MKTFSALLLVLYPAVAFAVGRTLTPIQFGTPGYSTTVVGSASLGSDFLTVCAVQHDRTYDLYAEVTDATGHRVNDTPRLIGSGVTQALAVEAAGDHYVVVTSDANNAIHLLFLNRDGVFTGPPAPAIEGFFEAIATSEQRTLIVRGTDRVYTSLFADVLDTSGNPIRTGIPLGDTPQASVDAAATNEGFAVAVSDYKSTRIHRLSRDGAAIGNAITLNRTLFPLSLASDGNDFLLVGPSLANFIDGVLVTRDGAIAAPRQLATYTTRVGRAIWTGDHYVVAMADRGESAISAVSLSANGAVGETVFLTRDPEMLSSFATNGSAILGVTQRGSTITAHTWTGNGAMTAEVLMTLPGRQTEPAIAGGDDGFLTVWSETRDGATRLLATLDSSMQPIELARDLSALPHAVAYGNGVYLVVWRQSTDFVAKRIRSDGVVLDNAPIVIASRTSILSAPSLAWTGSNFFVVTPASNGLQPAVVTTDGVVLPGQPINAAVPTSAAPSTVWDGARFTIAWEASFGGGAEGAPRQADVWLVSTNEAGVPLSQPVRVARPAFVPRLSSSGAETLLTFTDHNGIEAAIVRGGDAPRVDSVATLFPWRAEMPISTVTWTGSEFAVNWLYDIRTAYDHQWFLGNATVSRDGAITRRAYTPVQSIDADAFYPYYLTSSMAHGQLIVGVPEYRGPSARITGYSNSDFAPLPAAPSPPANPRLVLLPSGSVLTWTDVSNDEDGFFAAQQSSYLAQSYVVAERNSQVLTLPWKPYSMLEISAWNAGGFSAAVPVRVERTGRRRAIR